MRNNIVPIFILVLLSIIFLGTSKKECNVKSNKLRYQEPKRVLLRPNQDMLNECLRYVNKNTNKTLLNGFCDKKEYTYATLDTQRLRILKLYTNLALKRVNDMCKEYFIKHNSSPFVFKFIEIINATSAIDKQGNSRWNVNLMVEETTLHFSLRFILDFVVNVSSCNGKSPLTCAEYTTFPFPRYFVGYPTLDQMIPLPSQVIVSGRDVLGQKGKDPNYPNFKGLYLNSIKLENSDLAIGTDLKTRYVPPAVNDTALPSSDYPRKKFTQEEVSFPEKNYSDCLEKKGNVINTDIVNTFRPTPFNYKCTGKPENSYHNEGPTESYVYSVAKPEYPPGWIEPAKIRNKWPRLWSEPRDRFEWPSTPVSHEWDNIGIRKPVKDSCDKPGIRWSTQQPPRTAQYWPTITGIPTHGGPNYWLFDQTRGFTANLPHGGN